MSENILDTIDLVKLGRELQRARKKAKITQEQAAEVIQVSRTTITAIENGQRRIRASELMKLARVYNIKVNDLVRPRPDVEPFEPQFRSKGELTEEMVAEITPFVYELEDVSRNYFDLEQITNSPLTQNYPQPYEIENLDVEYAAEDLAHRERNRLGLGDAPIQNLRKILERDVGLRIFYLAIKPSNKFSAIYIFDQKLGGCIAINRLHPKTRRRFDLAHDYAHFLAHRFTAKILIYDNYTRVPQRERFADLFGTHFLMPATSIKRQLANIRRNKPDITLADLITLADYFGVSLEAITRRLEDMKEIRPGSWDTIKRSRYKLADGRAELGLVDTPDEEEDKFPHRYQFLAFYALDNDLISEGRFARLLEKDLVDVSQAFDELQAKSTNSQS